MSPATHYEEAVREMRRAKDAAFRAEPWSPVPHHERASFKGLQYYPADPRWRFEVKLVPHAAPKAMTMQASGGEAREYHNVGHFDIHAEGQDVRVQAYRADGSDSLFIPFRDRTSGKETYGAGRYLDLEWEGPEAVYALDFNLAYNPYCAYDESFSCPFPPPENWLQVPVTAGEKTYDAGH
jgi:uncharacterized protein (DUF1684 family)